MAHGGSYDTIATQFMIGKSTAETIIREVSNAIWEALSPIYLKVPDKEEWMNISRNFEQKYEFPMTLGCLDGKHFHIKVRLL